MEEFVAVGTKDEILGLNDITIEKIPVPEWKKTVFMKGMTASERDDWEAEMFVLRKKGDIAGMTDFRARFVSRCLCNEKGELLFSAKDVKDLGAKSAKAIDRLFDAAQEINGMRKKDIEKGVENLPEGQSVV